MLLGIVTDGNEYIRDTTGVLLNVLVSVGQQLDGLDRVAWNIY